MKYLFQSIADSQNWVISILHPDTRQVVHSNTYPSYTEDAATGALLPDETLVDLKVMAGTSDVKGYENYLKQIKVINADDTLITIADYDAEQLKSKCDAAMQEAIQKLNEMKESLPEIYQKGIEDNPQQMIIMIAEQARQGSVGNQSPREVLEERFSKSFVDLCITACDNISFAKGGTIDTDTVLIPELIADQVASGFVTTNPAYKSINVNQKASIGLRLTDYLVDKANTLYKKNENFRKQLNASGNKGRDTLYAFMAHWAEAWTKKGMWKFEKGGDIISYSTGGSTIAKKKRIRMKKEDRVLFFKTAMYLSSYKWSLPRNTVGFNEVTNVINKLSDDPYNDGNINMAIIFLQIISKSKKENDKKTINELISDLTKIVKEIQNKEKEYAAGGNLRGDYRKDEHGLTYYARFGNASLFSVGSRHYFEYGAGKDFEMYSLTDDQLEDVLKELEGKDMNPLTAVKHLIDKADKENYKKVTSNVAARDDLRIARNNRYHSGDRGQMERLDEAAAKQNAEILKANPETLKTIINNPDVRLLIISPENTLSSQLLKYTGDSYNVIDFSGSISPGEILTHNKTGQKFTVLSKKEYEYLFENGGSIDNDDRGGQLELFAKGGTIDEKIEKLKQKKSALESKHFDARMESNRKFNNIGFGTGMRHSKIRFSTSKEDNIKNRIDNIQKDIDYLISLKSSGMSGDSVIKFDEGGTTKTTPEERKRVAVDILNQLGGTSRLTAMTGAYNFVAHDNGVSFKLKNRKANYVKITVSSLDLYDIEIGRITGHKYQVVATATGYYNDMLKPFIEKHTGMYLSLYEKGGQVKPEKTNAELFKEKYGVEARKVFDDMMSKWKDKNHYFDFRNFLEEFNLPDDLTREEIYYAVMEGDLEGIKVPETLKIQSWDSNGARIYLKPIDKPLPKPVEGIKLLENIVSKDVLRPAMMGVYLDAEKQQMVATDAHALAILPQKITGKSRVVNPKTGAVIDLGGGRYPDYNVVIPQSNVLKYKNISVEKLYKELLPAKKAEKFIDTKYKQYGIACLFDIGIGLYFVNTTLLFNIIEFFAKANVKNVDIEFDPIIKEINGTTGVIIRNSSYPKMMALLMPLLYGVDPNESKGPFIEIDLGELPSFSLDFEEMVKKDWSYNYHKKELYEAQKEKNTWGIRYSIRRLKEAYQNIVKTYNRYAEFSGKPLKSDKDFEIKEVIKEAKKENEVLYTDSDIDEMVKDGVLEKVEGSLIKTALKKKPDADISRVIKVSETIAKHDNKKRELEHVAEALQYEVSFDDPDYSRITFKQAKQIILNNAPLENIIGDLLRMRELGIILDEGREDIKEAREYIRLLNLLEPDDKSTALRFLKNMDIDFENDDNVGRPYINYAVEFLRTAINRSKHEENGFLLEVSERLSRLNEESDRKQKQEREEDEKKSKKTTGKTELEIARKTADIVSPASTIYKPYQNVIEIGSEIFGYDKRGGRWQLAKWNKIDSTWDDVRFPDKKPEESDILKEYDFKKQEIKKEPSSSLSKITSKVKKSAAKEKKPKRTKQAIAADKKIKAKKPGKRVSDSGNVYHENRPNRSDEDLRKKI